MTKPVAPTQGSSAPVIASDVAKADAAPAKKAAAPKKTAASKEAVAVKKAPAAKKASASKDSAAAPAKKPARSKAAPAQSNVVSLDERHHLIEVAAYYIAERQGFTGDAEQHWLEASQQIDAMIASGSFTSR